MYLRQHSIAVIARIALFAMLMLALAPAVSRWLASAPDNIAIPFCHAAGEGMSHVHTHASGDSLALQLDDCGYCSMQADLPALSPAPAYTSAVLHLVRWAPRLFYHAPQPLFAWHGVQSRGPPAF
jgi:hypothetical protein